jgi:hypothetical protein
MSDADEAAALAIAIRWVERFGLGFDPDCAGADYDPPIGAANAARYDADMRRPRLLGVDPYAVALHAMREAGLIPDGEATP